MWFWYVIVSTDKGVFCTTFFGNVPPYAVFLRHWFSRPCSQAYWWLLGWCLCIHPSDIIIIIIIKHPQTSSASSISCHLMPSHPSWRLQVSCCLQGRAWAPVADPRMSVSLLGQAEPLKIQRLEDEFSFLDDLFSGVMLVAGRAHYLRKRILDIFCILQPESTSKLILFITYNHLWHEFSGLTSGLIHLLLVESSQAVALQPLTSNTGRFKVFFRTRVLGPLKEGSKQKLL